MISYADRVFETSTTNGTGTLNLDGAQIGYQTFVDGTSNGAKVPYAIFDDTNWEVGQGTVVAGSPDQLQRDVVLSSSNGGSAINWGAGTRNVILPLSSTFGVWRDEKLNDTSSIGVGGGTGNAQTVTMTPAPLGFSDRMIVRWKAAAGNTGAVTLNVNALGAKAYVDGVGTAFSSGAIVSGSLQQAFYDLANDRFVSLSVIQTPTAAGVSLNPSGTPVTATNVQDGFGQLGTASTKNVGTAAGNVVQLDGSARLPAVDGSQLTGLPSPIKAWCTVQVASTVVTVLDSFNVDSVSRDSQGVYTITFDNDLSNANYAVLATSVGDGTQTGDVVIAMVHTAGTETDLPSLKTTTQLRVATAVSGGTDEIDPSQFYVLIVGS